MNPVSIEEDPSDEERDCFSTLAPLPKFGIGHSEQNYDHAVCNLIVT